jgi:hypothetical protein
MGSRSVYVEYKIRTYKMLSAYKFGVYAGLKNEIICN